MSVIGPRPGLWNQDILTAERDKYNANDVKPGLTGWAQINGRDELEIPEKASAIIIYKLLRYFLESDFNINEGFDYIGCNENIMHFESPKGIEINILYGKWWPEAIEIKNKEIPGRLRDWFFYQNFIYTDENGKRHECEFWGTEEYNQDMYIIESINLRENGQLVKRAIIIKKEKEDYIMAELSEAEIVFKIFAEKHK